MYLPLTPSSYDGWVILRTLSICSNVVPLLLEFFASSAHLTARRLRFLKIEVDRALVACELAETLLECKRENGTIIQARQRLQRCLSKLEEIAGSNMAAAEALGPCRESESSSDFLPTEIFWLVSSFVSSPQDILNLCLVNRAFYRIFTKRLYTSISLLRTDYKDIRMSLFNLTITLRSNRDLAALVKDFTAGMQGLDEESLDEESPVPTAMEEEDPADMVYEVVSDPFANTEQFEWSVEPRGKMRSHSHDTLMRSLLLESMINLDAVHLHFNACLRLSGWLNRAQSMRIKHLDLSFSSIKKFPVLSHEIRSLQELLLRDCGDLRTTEFTDLVHKCPNLRAIGINGCENLSDSSIFELLSCCPKLEAIAFGYRQQFKSIDAVIGNITHHMPRLNAFFLDGRDRVPEYPLYELITTRGHQIKTLSLSFCLITDKLVDLVAERCVNLEALALNGCKGAVTDESVTRVMEKCQNLTVFSLLENEGVSCKVDQEVINRFGWDVPTIVEEFRYWKKWKA
ncbi:uncharacterized protein SPPG_05317 [Spizellomyces punctatus DAOM BR117]|uniref:F-box domain-containing protein n=1 Tax=Spizellomyces punctatus (strain DAOM BR117) TaxID=645134 RepID=A0A0L0HGB0_SPIPD|nr:uncharacterized protein SPPG_05317 [Spizellomyces punctatus DAOM BR117]KNC99944.1 hypothetical protein SPPG_05317 [Spizellomyces punctatus DAOM BR117]|eukprot:XP_016607984.1 hypothetical protein SPPG_05317 [Spizellomyces punctatus DAOM BR117]